MTALIGLAATLAIPAYSGASTLMTQHYSSVWGDFNKDGTDDFFAASGTGDVWYVESNGTGYTWKKLDAPVEGQKPDFAHNIIKVVENDTGYYVHVKDLEGKILTYKTTPSKTSP